MERKTGKQIVREIQLAKHYPNATEGFVATEPVAAAIEALLVELDMLRPPTPVCERNCRGCKVLSCPKEG